MRVGFSYLIGLEDHNGLLLWLENFFMELENLFLDKIVYAI